MNVAALTGRLPLPDAVRERMPVATAQVAVVRLDGVITPAGSPGPRRGGLTLEGLEPTLVKAFGLPGLEAVALAISSPGGAPTQSALIADRIRGLAAEHEVPVLAFCEDVAASGGYWLACAADEIVAHPTSLVGSIGVVAGGFGLHEVIERHGIQRRLHTAGENKARLDPFQPERDEDVAWLQGELDALHGMFSAWVRERRGDRLGGDPATVFSGEVWTGPRALELGLVDGLGTLRGVVGARWPDAKITPISSHKALLRTVLGMATADRGPDRTVQAVLRGLEDRATWARFGL